MVVWSAEPTCSRSQTDLEEFCRYISAEKQKREQLDAARSSYSDEDDNASDENDKLARRLFMCVIENRPPCPSSSNGEE